MGLSLGKSDAGGLFSYSFRERSASAFFCTRRVLLTDPLWNRNFGRTHQNSIWGKQTQSRSRWYSVQTGFHHLPRPNSEPWADTSTNSANSGTVFVSRSLMNLGHKFVLTFNPLKCTVLPANRAPAPSFGFQALSSKTSGTIHLQSHR